MERWLLLHCSKQHQWTLLYLSIGLDCDVPIIEAIFHTTMAYLVLHSMDNALPFAEALTVQLVSDAGSRLGTYYFDLPEPFRANFVWGKEVKRISIDCYKHEVPGVRVELCNSQPPMGCELWVTRCFDPESYLRVHHRFRLVHYLTFVESFNIILDAAVKGI